jgi:hypothetical protein
MRIGWLGATLLVPVLAGAVANGAPRNEFNERLEQLSPADQAAKLAEVVGHWCVGTQAFFMGMSGSGPEAGYVYWSLRCLDGNSYAIQFDPLGQGVVIDCRTLAENGQGRECFKKF